MKKIISNNRGAASYRFNTGTVIQSSSEIINILSDAARGGDAVGEDIAEKCSISIKHPPADEQGCGKSIGPLRDMEIGSCAEAVITMRGIESRISDLMLAYVEQLELTAYADTVGLDQINQIRTVAT